MQTTRVASTDGFRARMEVSEQFARVFFSQRGWNDIKRAGLHAGGTKWIVDYLPLRFTAYAIGALGYHARGHGTLPLVDRGRLREGALSKSWADAKVTSKMAVLTLHISTPTMLDHKGNSTGLGYSANRIVYDTLRQVTPREVEVIAVTTEAAMMALIDGASPTVTRRGTVKGALTHTQRESISHTRRPQWSAKTTRN